MFECSSHGVGAPGVESMESGRVKQPVLDAFKRIRNQVIA